MWSRRFLGAAALATILSCPARAQIEDSGLEQVDPWGIDFLEENEPSLRTGMWRGARGEDLLALVQGARTQELTPAERLLMRRMVLSGARAPAGEEADALLAERARIAFELGEARAAAGLLARIGASPDGTDTAALAADLNLALGNEATACDALYEPGHEGAYWAKLRAVCAALAGNTSGAELAIEIAQQQGVKDAWLVSAVFATSGELPNPPRARFDSGLNFAMSTRANLEVTPEAVPEDRPDLAAAMARRKLMPPAVRVKAARIAAEAGLISADEYRTAYNSALAADGFTPVTPLDKAVFVSSDATTSTMEKIAALEEALVAAYAGPSLFTATALLLSPHIARLPVNEETRPQAILFARASVAAGNLVEAIRWITPPEPEVIAAEAPADPADDAYTLAAEAGNDAPADPEDIAPADAQAEPGSPAEFGESDAAETASTDETTAGEKQAGLEDDMEPEPEPEPEPPSFDAAWIGALVILADSDASSSAIAETAQTLMAAAQTEAEKQEAARMFALWTAAGTAPPSDARTYMADNSAEADSLVPPGEALSVLAAARSGTASEVILKTVGLTNGDPSWLSLADLSLLLAALEDIGAEDAARSLALEASGYWKSTP